MLGKESENHCEMEARFERPMHCNGCGEQRGGDEIHLERRELGDGGGQDFSDCPDWNV